MIRQRNPRNGEEYWTLPGGGLEAGDADLFAGAVREVYEETGLRVVAGDMRFISEYANTAQEVMQISVWVRCTLAEGEDPESIHLENTQHDDNISAVAWWEKEALLESLHASSSLRKPEFWIGLEAPHGAVMHLGKTITQI